MSTLEETMGNIRAERIARRSIPCERKKENNIEWETKEDNIEYYIEDINKEGETKEVTKEDNTEDIEDINTKTRFIDELLKELKKNEPTSDNLFYRLSIIAYEMGDLHRSIVYSERFKNESKIRAGYLANGKLAFADILTQLYLLSITLHWDFYELRKLGADHLAERHEDFKRDGWNDLI